MTILRTFALALLLPCLLNAQVLQHSLRAHPDDAVSSPGTPSAALGAYKVLAVMVQFQTDSDSRTSGNGQFDTSHVTSGDVPIDAPPRNASYFEDHLTFLRNYYQKASKGKVTITTTLIPQVITLSKVMSAYAPLRNGPTTPVAFLAYDTWRIVDSLDLAPGVLSSYDAYVIFHAGVGHDIDMVSLLGYDPTDRDIPSLYFGPSAFLAAFGTQAGIPLKNGRVIPNTIVLPETESRTIEGVTGNTLLEYGINGLLCASFGNYLGLPDLFNTKTGATAIGRFGLMDGQGFFSFNGLFPPEPSAWEKYWLGWVKPIDVPAGTRTLNLPAVALADTMYRIPIGPREYYLVENRNRDPQRNGQSVMMNYNGTTTTLRFARDTADFNFYDITALKGNITDVEDLDWSLPGGVDDSIFYDGGILIWHIDERVIAEQIGSNSVNADPSRRGIDLEEADGSQDIGQSYGSLTAGSGSEIGTALDFWYVGNASPVNKNEFSATTYPSTASNDGGESHVAMRSFSARGPRMTVQVSVGDSVIAALPGFPKETQRRLTWPSLTVGRLDNRTEPAIVVATQRDTLLSPQAGSRLYAWSARGTNAMPGGRTDGLLWYDATLPSNVVQAPPLVDLNGDGFTYVLTGENIADRFFGRVIAPRDANGDSLAELLRTFDVAPSGVIAPVFTGGMITYGDQKATLHLFDNNGVFIGSRKVLADSTAEVKGISTYPSPYAGIVTGSDGTVSLFADPRLAGPLPPERKTIVGHALAGAAVVGDFSGSTAPVPSTVVATRDGWVVRMDEGLGVVAGFPVKSGDRIEAPPALGDVNSDGLRDIVVFSGNRICAYNPSGALLDGFPVVLPTADSLASPPILGDIDGDQDVDIVGVTFNGLVAAVDGRGKTVRGFPLVAGQGKQTAAMFVTGDSIMLVVASSGTGTISGWLTGRTTGAATAAHYPWPQYQRDAQHSGVDLSAITGATALSNEFFPKNRAYNWPNPVYDRTTQIRYYVKEDARVDIRIFDLAGDLVTEFNGPGIGGRDNEVTWDVSEVQSGVYLARIEATGNGTTGLQVIKIAVVK